ncbi:MAG: radical SAM protein [Nitrososphaeria archaeon]
MKHENEQYAAINEIIKKLQKGLYPYPMIIEIQPSDICNQKCDYCFWNNTNYINKNRKPVMCLEEYDTLFKEMQNLGIRRLSISGGGEPFLDTRMPNLLELARRYELEVRIVTNGSILPDEAIHELMYCKEIRLSIDAIKPTTYSKIRNVPRNIFSQVLENLNKLIELKSERSSSLSIGVSFLLNEKNYLEVEDFCKYMLKLPIDAVVIKYNIYGLPNISKEKLNNIETSLKKLNDPRIEIRERLPLNKIRGMKCFIPYFKVAINPYGDLYSCCLGAQLGERNGYFLGNLHNKSFKDIWESAKSLIQNLGKNGVSCTCCNYTDYRINKTMSKLMIQ